MENLEWFTIFVSIKDWKLGASRKTSGDVDGEPDITLQPSEGNEKEFDCENDIPVENVKKQLGVREAPGTDYGRCKVAVSARNFEVQPLGEPKCSRDELSH